MNNQLNNDNNVLSNENLTLVLNMTSNLTLEANIRFKIGAPETSTIGTFQNVSEIFGKALTFALTERNIPYDKTTVVDRACAIGLRENFAKASDRTMSTETYKQIRREMLKQLRDSLTEPVSVAAIPATAPVLAKRPRELAYAND